MHHLFTPSRAVLALVLGLAAPLALHAAAKTSGGEVKARASDCFSCHLVDHKLVGPAYQEITRRYAGKGDAVVQTLVQKIKKGGAGNWGDVPMTAHPQLSDADLTLMVKWIMSLDTGAGSARAMAGNGGKSGGAGESHTYKTADGKSVKTDFAVFAGADQKHVTAAAFHGYVQFNSTCSRCHGGDAVGGQIAPDLRKSLENGMTFEQFLSTAMAGRQEKGMPAWAGFFEEKDIRDIYDYVKARQLDLIPEGRPFSSQD